MEAPRAGPVGPRPKGRHNRMSGRSNDSTDHDHALADLSTILAQVKALSEKSEKQTVMLSSCLDGISRLGKKKIKVRKVIESTDDCEEAGVSTAHAPPPKLHRSASDHVHATSSLGQPASERPGQRRHPQTQPERGEDERAEAHAAPTSPPFHSEGTLADAAEPVGERSTVDARRPSAGGIRRSLAGSQARQAMLPRFSLDLRAGVRTSTDSGQSVPERRLSPSMTVLQKHGALPTGELTDDGWQMPAINRHPMWGRIWKFFEYPHSSCGAMLYAYAINLTILACVLISWLEIQYPNSIASVAVAPVEAWFLIEVLVRFVASPNRAVFVFNFYNLVDMNVVLQIAVRLYFAASDRRDADVYQTLKVFFPPIMLLKMLRRFPSFNLLLSAFHNAFEALPVLLYTLTVILLLFAGLIYIAEPRTNIQGINDALWLTCVSLSTVGYGDQVPVSPWGKFWTGNLLVVGALYMAIPIGIVGTAFSKVWEDRDRLFMLCDIRDRVVQAGITPADLLLIYQELDEDGDGLLDLREFRKMFQLLKIEMGENMSARIFDKLDADSEGTIDFEEMLVGMFPTHKIILRLYKVATKASDSLMLNSMSTQSFACHSKASSQICEEQEDEMSEGGDETHEDEVFTRAADASESDGPEGPRAYGIKAV